MVVASPWPGNTVVSSGKGSSLSWMERRIWRPSPPGKSVRPMLSRKSVSPAKADAALGVAGGVEHVEFGGAHQDAVAVSGGGVDGDLVGLRYAEPGGLHGEHLLQFGVIEIHVDGSAGGLLELLRAADVIDMRVGDHDGGDLETMAGEDFENARDFVAGVDDHGLAGLLIAEDGAVALQRADGQNLVDHAAPKRAFPAVRGKRIWEGSAWTTPMTPLPAALIVSPFRRRLLARFFFAGATITLVIRNFPYRCQTERLGRGWPCIGVKLRPK
jgi:hypothetical protein